MAAEGVEEAGVVGGFEASDVDAEGLLEEAGMGISGMIWTRVSVPGISY